MSFKAEIIADSITEHGNRLTSYVVTFPRIVLAEFNTHRMFSRNSASSRAIPFKKMVKSVRNNPFIPLGFQKDHSGMQGTEYITGFKLKLVRLAWWAASRAAICTAMILNWLGVTKQICNRILEPFMWHTVIVTSSEWENFFALRAQDQAEIHIQKLAYMMLEEYNKSAPKVLKAGEWHIPFGNNIDQNKAYNVFRENIGLIPNPEYHDDELQKFFIKIAVARCARVSYTVVGEESKGDNYLNDIKLYDRLLKSGHWSPFEHVRGPSK
ncbi:MAG: hypothetical protein HC836_35915 [Richelia sp. RM2_1_2]|nr:hypothetical protein [Richelia sp. RM2_1_2]